MNSEVHMTIKNKPFWFSLAAIVVYLLLGYLVLPSVLQPRLEQFVSHQLGFPVKFDRVRFDPITWSADLVKLRLDTTDSELWPGVTLSAQALHLRFNFWRLEPRVSEMVLRSPQLDIAAGHELLSSGPYPFFDQWRLWQAQRKSLELEQPLSPRHFRVQNGRVQLINAESGQTMQVLLEGIDARIGKPDSAGVRNYKLAFSTAEMAMSVEVRGQLSAGSAESSGSYQWQLSAPSELPGELLGTSTSAALPHGEARLRLEGSFSASEQSNRLLIELSDSRINQDQDSSDQTVAAPASSAGIPLAAYCAMDGLLCAAWSSPQGSFTASLTAATDGIHLLEAESELTGFSLQTFLAQGRVKFSERLQINTARIKLNPTSETTGSIYVAAEYPQNDAALNFEAELEGANGSTYSLQGQFSRNRSVLESAAATIQFAMTGQQQGTGELQLHSRAATALRDAYSEVSLELQNPGASLARDFFNAQLSGGHTASSLQLQMFGIIEDATLKFSERVHFEKFERTADPTTGGVVSEDNDRTGALLPWLLDRQGDLVLEQAEYQLPLTGQYRLDSVLQMPLVEVLAVYEQEPVQALCAQLGIAAEDISEIEFEAGMAALDASNSARVAALAKLLLQRPGLVLEWAGVFDPLIDTKALQTEQVRTHIALAMAADLSFQSGSVPPDFTDPIVHSVIDEFARQRLPPKVLASFTEHFGVADADQGVIPEGNVADYYETLFELLVDYAEIPQGALITLARYRAQAVSDGLADLQVAEQQWRIAEQPQAASALLEGVPMPLRLYAPSVGPLQQAETPDEEGGTPLPDQGFQP